MKSLCCDLDLEIRGRSKRSGELLLICPCGEKYQCRDGGYSHPYRTHPNKLDEKDIKKVRSVRLSDRQLELIELGILRLVVIDKRITFAG